MVVVVEMIVVVRMMVGGVGMVAVVAVGMVGMVALVEAITSVHGSCYDRSWLCRAPRPCSLWRTPWSLGFYPTRWDTTRANVSVTGEKG